MTTLIIKKDISHFNRELGIRINSEHQYKDELKRRGLVTKEQGDDIAKRAQEKNKLPYTPTDKTLGFLRNVNERRNKDGSVKLSGREITYMEKLGVKFGDVQYKGTKGGFDAND